MAARHIFYEEPEGVYWVYHPLSTGPFKYESSIFRTDDLPGLPREIWSIILRFKTHLEMQSMHDRIKKAGSERDWWQDMWEESVASNENQEEKDMFYIQALQRDRDTLRHWTKDAVRILKRKRGDADTETQLKLYDLRIKPLKSRTTKDT